MGGLGKSTIAARLCDRLSEHEPIIWWRQFDESSLVNKLADKIKLADNIRNAELRTALKESIQELKYRLRDVLGELNQPGEKPFLLVFDDFEWNLEHRQGRYILKAQVAEILKALVWAIKENNAHHRIIITCRYDFESELLQSFYKQPLESFRKSDLQKKLSRLKAFNSEEINSNLIERAKTLADGNPRLLEWLSDEVLLEEEAETKLTQLEANPGEWKGKIIWEELYEQLDPTIEKILSRCLVFEVPVPRTALEGICNSISGYEKQLERAIELGLIEVSPEADESKTSLPSFPASYPTSYPLSNYLKNQKSTTCTRKLTKHYISLWGNRENYNEEKWQEIFRLKFAKRDNYQRFREGFSDVLKVRDNQKADRAFKAELRKCRDDLVEHGLCAALEKYLQQQKWKDADEETAWIFYQVMVKENYENWDHLFKNLPCETLREIDQLWVQNSNSKFGISIQREIYQKSGEDWKEFCGCVGWREKQAWLSYSEIINKTTHRTQADMTHGETQTLPSEESVIPGVFTSTNI